MTDAPDHPDYVEIRSNDHQQVVEACQHAIDALNDGRLPHAQALLDEARAAVERAQHDDSGQTQREIAYDC